MLPRLSVAFAIVLVAMAGGLALGAVLDAGDTGAQQRAASDAATCSADVPPLHIAADPAVAHIVQRLADGYATELIERGRECVPIDVVPTSSSAMVGRLTNGWKDRVHGPAPQVWIPQSSLWVDLLRTQMPDPSIISDEHSVLARSPTVLAMPRPMAEALGWPDTQVSWADILQLADSDDGWAQRGHPEWGPFRLRLTDPRYTVTGLQALLALDGAQQTDQSGTMLSLFRVQRVLAGIDADAREELERYTRADDLADAFSAVPLEERQVWEYNRGGVVSQAAGSGDTADSAQAGTGTEVAAVQVDNEGAASAAPRRTLPDLVAVYPTGNEQIAMESDYPYLVLDAPWVRPAVLQFADEFGDYLLSRSAVEQFAQAGLRTPDNRFGARLRDSSDVTPSAVPAGAPAGRQPDVEAVERLRSRWVTVPRLSTTLYVVDVSGSMQELVPGTGETRLQATIDAAKRSLEIVPPGSDVGLWEFSTDLEGGRHQGDYRELVEPGPLNDLVGDQTRKDQLDAALDGLEARNDTALNDTLLAAYETMRAGYTPGQRHTIVLLTDGRNDDRDSISHEELLDGLQALRKPDQPIQVVSIAYGEEADVDELADASELVGGKVLRSPDVDDLDQLFIEALAQ